MAPENERRRACFARAAMGGALSTVVVGLLLKAHPYAIASACVLIAAACGYLLFDRAALARNGAEDALWYRNLFDSALNAVIVVDAETRRVEDANAAALALYGYSREEFLGRSIEELSSEPLKTRASFDRAIDGVHRGVLPVFTHRKKNGKIFPVEMSLSFCSARGHKKAVGVIHDLTLSREQERETRRSERRYRCLFENSHDALMTSEFPGEFFSSANAAAVAMFRANGEKDFLTRTPGELSPEFQPDGRPSREKAREYMAATLFEGSQHFEWVHKRFDGEEFPADVLLARTESEGELFIQATIRDLTEVNGALAEKKLLSTAIEQASECVVITDAAARIIYVNPAFERVTGYPRAEVLGKKPSVLKSGRHGAAFYKAMWAVLGRGEVWRGRLYNRRKDGSIYEEESSIAPVRGDDGAVTHYIAVKRDVSGERTLEEQLLQAQKMEGIGRLAGGVAHDFNNLLTAISGYSYFLLSEMAPENPQRADVQEIARAGERAAALTRQLLAFSRQQVLLPRVVDPNALIREFQKMLRRLVGEDVALKTDLSESAGRIKADPGQIEQVIMNLVVNARDAMPRGGTITIGTRNAEEAEGGASTVPAGSYVVLEVSDDGCGMDAKTVARIFEPFFTTKERGKGTGLGLSTVYGIIQQSGGHILVDSEPGRGTRFSIYMPRVEEDAAGGAVRPEPRAGIDGHETVLLVEDDELARAPIRRVLQQRGYRLMEAGDPNAAIRLCEGGEERIDLLLTDIVMPGMRGDEMADAIARVRPGIKVVFTSGYTEAGVLRGSVAAAGAAFIQKPIDPEALARLIREVLDSPNGAKP